MMPKGARFTKRRDFKKKCRFCRATFYAADIKASKCPKCLEVIQRACGCGCAIVIRRSRFKLVDGKFFYYNHAKIGKTYKQIYGTSQPACGFQTGLANVAKDPKVGAKISATLRKVHPAYKEETRQQYIEMGHRMNQNRKWVKTSKLETIVGKTLTRGWRHQFVIGSYHVDFAHPRNKHVIEVNGCWWHCCSSCGIVPTTEKQINNLRNDKRKRTYLRRNGWTVRLIWEHEVYGRPVHNNQRNRNRRRTSRH